LFNETLFPFAHDSNFTASHIPFSSSLSSWSPQSKSSFLATPSIKSNISPLAPNFTYSLIPLFLSTSCPIPVVPPSTDTPSSVDDPSPPSLSVANPVIPSPSPSTVPNSTTLIPSSNNSHPMITRSKHGIYKPRVM